MDRIDEQLIIAALAGEATDEEIHRLAEWRAMDPENEHEFQHLVKVWAASGELLALEGEVPVPAAGTIVAIAKQRFQDERSIISLDHTTRSGLSGARKIRRLATLAATLILGVGLGMLLSESKTQQPYGSDVLVTGVDEVATITLADETVIRLAPSSRLEFSKLTREVFLSGRAYFAVSKQPGRPFRVIMPDGEIEVLGTRFDVQGGDRPIRVAVVEGHVKVSANGSQVSVTANQIAYAGDQGGPEVEEVDDIYQASDWVGDFLAFNSTPMEQVAEEFNGRFGLQIQITDSTLLKRTITGWFADSSPEEIVARICRAIDARCTEFDDYVLIE